MVIYFYNTVYDYTSEEFQKQLDQAKDAGESVILRVNSPGGSVFAGWGMITAWRKFEGEKKIEVHGMASSMMSVLLTFSDDNVGISQSAYVIHRASNYYESMDKDAFDMVEKVNKDILKAYTKKLDVGKFEEKANMRMKDFFAIRKDEPPINMLLDAKEAKAIGFINKIDNISPEITKKIEAEAKASPIFAISDSSQKKDNPIEIITKIDEITGYPSEVQEVSPIIFKKISNFIEKNLESKNKPLNIDPKSNNTMEVKINLAHIKSNYADIYQAIKAEGIQEGITQERDRALAWMGFAEVDAKIAEEKIKDGSVMGQSDMVDLTKKLANKAIIKDAEDENNPDTPPGGETKGKDEDKEVDDFMNNYKEDFGFSKKRITNNGTR